MESSLQCKEGTVLDQLEKTRSTTVVCVTADLITGTKNCSNTNSYVNLSAD